MARPARTRRRRPGPRKRPVTAALLRLNRDYRLWALLPAGVNRILFQADDPLDTDGCGDIVGDARRPSFPKGVCCKCGCSEFDACHTSIGPCGWVDVSQTLCTACEGRR